MLCSPRNVCKWDGQGWVAPSMLQDCRLHHVAIRFPNFKTQSTRTNTFQRAPRMLHHFTFLYFYWLQISQFNMSAFSSKKKGRVIRTLDDGTEDGASSSPSGMFISPNPLKSPLLIDTSRLMERADVGSSDSTQVPVKFGKRPLKQSSLRRSINVNDDDGSPSAITGASDGDGGPVVVRPLLGRSGSTKLKKKSSSSRLSFGPGEGEASADGADVSTPKKTPLSQRVLENTALKKSISQRLPTRATGEDEDRTRYSQAYLEELQSSTPNTPQNLASLRIQDDDEMDLDSSELEGALIIESNDSTAQSIAAPAQVLSEAEIRERKERRARLAQEKEYISLSNSDEDERDGNYIALSTRTKKKKEEPRLVPEDEDLGEGFDEFVEDEGLSLGKKAEKEARRRRKHEMAELINAAEAGGREEDGETSDDSEAERRAAYEAAQTRAGMDGLHRPDELNGSTDGIPRMKPLPDLAESLARMHSLVSGLGEEVSKKRQRIADLEKEKAEIMEREAEVQKILDQAGQKYQSEFGAAGGIGAAGAAQSPFRPIPPGLAGDFPVERGLESLGATPTRPALDIDDMAG